MALVKLLQSGVLSKGFGGLLLVAGSKLDFNQGGIRELSDGKRHSVRFIVCHVQSPSTTTRAKMSCADLANTT